MTIELFKLPLIWFSTNVKTKRLRVCIKSLACAFVVSFEFVIYYQTYSNQTTMKLGTEIDSICKSEKYQDLILCSELFGWFFYFLAFFCEYQFSIQTCIYYQESVEFQVFRIIWCTHDSFLLLGVSKAIDCIPVQNVWKILISHFWMKSLSEHFDPSVSP